MFNKREMFIPAAFMLVGFLSVTAANAQVPACPYSLATLQGNYAIIGTYGSNVAIALGTRYFDGNGNLTGNAIINEPTAGSTTGARTIVTATQVGTYTINCDGTGIITRVVTSGGVSTPQLDNFVITGTTTQTSGGSALIATSLMDAQQTPSAIVAGGIFLTRSYTRLPPPVYCGACYQTN
jgi:hypothetical protein